MVRADPSIIASGLRSIRALEAVPTVETALFVAACVPRRMHLLEIGCGNGELAMLLGRVGFQVTAIDSDPRAVTSARAKGVDASLACWPEEGPEGPFDAVLFTRSLHHHDALAPALERARDATIPAGMLLVEDFAYEAIEPASAAWFRAGLKRCADRGLLRDDESFAARIAACADDAAAVEEWHRERGDHVQTSLAMDAAIRAAYGDVRSSRCPYFYRYLLAGLARDRNGFLALREWLAAEQVATIERKIEPIGRRYVARNN